jgi:serine/threonine protein kinase
MPHVTRLTLLVVVCFVTWKQQYMERGSLRNVLSVSEQWQEYTPAMRHQILCDVAEGMAFLHAQDVFHRDLKRYCCTVLLYTCYPCTRC